MVSWRVSFLGAVLRQPRFPTAEHFQLGGLDHGSPQPEPQDTLSRSTLHVRTALSWCLSADSWVLVLKWLRPQQTGQELPEKTRTPSWLSGWTRGPASRRGAAQQRLLSELAPPGAAALEQARLRRMPHYRGRCLPISQPALRQGKRPVPLLRPVSPEARGPGRPRRAVTWGGEAQAAAPVRQVFSQMHSTSFLPPHPCIHPPYSLTSKGIFYLIVIKIKLILKLKILFLIGDMSMCFPTQFNGLVRRSSLPPPVSLITPRLSSALWLTSRILRKIQMYVLPCHLPRLRTNLLQGRMKTELSRPPPLSLAL